MIPTQECQMYKLGHTGDIRKYLRAYLEFEADAVIKMENKTGETVRNIEDKT